MKINKSYTLKEAKLLLERYCIYQDRCHLDVQKKLNDINMIPEAQEIIIMNLIQNNFLNEERFAKSFARGKFKIKKWGKFKIITQLKFRKISAVNIKTALNEIEDEAYFETINKLVLKKLKTLNEKSTFIKKKKVLNYLLSKGYGFSDVINIINENV